MSKVSGEIIAHSPTFHERMTIPYRFVIREFEGEYVVHTQHFRGEFSSDFSDGSYFVFKDAVAKSKALTRAWKKFVQSVERHALQYQIATAEQEAILKANAEMILANPFDVVGSNIEEPSGN